MTPIELIHTLNLNDIPEEVKKQAKLSILDLIFNEGPKSLEILCTSPHLPDTRG